MRASSTSRLLICAAASFSLFTFACADLGDPLLDGPTGRVEITVAPLQYGDITGARYKVTIEDGSTKLYETVANTDQYGSPDGRLLLIAPCMAGPTGPKPNTVTVELLEVFVGTTTLRNGSGAFFPPPVSQTITCTENFDVRAPFLLTFVRPAQQGFADIVVQVRDIFCSFKVSCEDDLMAAPGDNTPGPTLVTGFACTQGEAADDRFIGFEGALCCGASDARVCTTVGIDSADGSPVWSPVQTGVLATRSYQGETGAPGLGTLFHNTTWRLDPANMTNCTFVGKGFFNYGEAPVSYAYNPGGNGVSPAPQFNFSTGFAVNDGAVSCTGNNVTTGFPPVVTGGAVAKTKGAGLRLRRSNTGDELFVGAGDLGVGANRAQAEYPPGNDNHWQDDVAYRVTFTYDPATGASGSVKRPDADTTSRTWTTFGPPGCAPADFDRIEIWMRGNTSPLSTTKLTDIRLAPLTLAPEEGFTIPDQDAGTGIAAVGVTGFDFTAGFTVTGTLVTTGWGGGNLSAESAKLEIGVHCPPTP